MTYDDWKLESPEDEAYRLSDYQRRQKARAEWAEEHADYLLERKQECARMRREDD